MHPFDYYPTGNEIQYWIDRLFEEADKRPVTATGLGHRGERMNVQATGMPLASIHRFEQEGMRPFYGMWTPYHTGGPRPLVVHTPGYGAEMSFHAELCRAGYNVLELSPLGYWTPDGMATDLQWQDESGNIWPVLPNTVLDPYSLESYFGWMLNVIGAIRWAMSQPSVIPDRVCFFGTSQGGGASLLLGSIFKGHGTRCVCADEPFLTNYPMSEWRGAYDHARLGFEKMEDKARAWHNVGFVDTMAHAARMTYPVLLTLGTRDAVCPPETVRALFDEIDAHKALISLKDHGHGYQYEFIHHVMTWLSLYA